MTSLKRGIVLTSIAAAGVAACSTVYAAEMALNSLTQACSQAAKEADHQRIAPPEGVDLCTRALDTALGTRDLAGVYVNRGVLHMIRGDLDAAMADFQLGLGLQPNLAEAHVNVGAAMVGMGRDKEGITAIDRGLTLGATEPEKAYYNRAVGEEHLDDLAAAYQDYRKAAELKPQWALPRKELDRFQVEPATNKP